MCRLFAFGFFYFSIIWRERGEKGFVISATNYLLHVTDKMKIVAVNVSAKSYHFDLNQKFGSFYVTRACVIRLNIQSPQSCLACIFLRVKVGFEIIIAHLNFR